MVFTRSMKQSFRGGAMRLMFSQELDRIQKDYDSTVEEEDNKKVRVDRGNLKKDIIPLSVPVPKFNFDDAHDEWVANKRRKSNGDYVYICGAPLKNGKKCNRDCCDKIGLYSGCRQHYSWEESELKTSKNCFEDY